MKKLVALTLVALVAVSAFAAVAIGRDTAPAASSHAAHTHVTVAGTKAAALKVKLATLLGEHVSLATQATQAGLRGGKEFPALAQALDRNSVAVANAIGSVYGKQARNQFLNGKLLWRDHIRFFVAYTTALAKDDAAGQKQAVGNLMGYVEAFSRFLSSATGLPYRTLKAGVTEHVLQLKGQLDAYDQGRYARSYALSREAHHHMVMTGETLADAIVKKFPKRFAA
jgi:hypothetical protein